MFKRIQSVLLTLVVLMTTAAFAYAKPCDPAKVAGSYIRLVANTNPEIPQVMDQLRLGSDGTAYWYQNIAFHRMVQTGSFIPQIGSWQCIDGKTLVVTTIGAVYLSNGTDLLLDSHVRYTAKLSITDDDTLESGPGTRVFRYFALTDDPSDPNASPIGGPTTNTNTTSFKRVKPVASDVP